MRINREYKRLHPLFWSIVILIALSSVATVVARRTNQAPTISITITNNRTGEIRHVYLSHTDRDDWSADQLNDSAIAPGGSTTLSNVSCDQANTKVIAEDQNGCFLYKVVACGENTTWTITNDATPDCGN
jgi:hypothetical protein